jgi:hypothetical protein
MAAPEFKVGDSVKVKEGVPIPDYENLCIGGWQGRVIERYSEEHPPGIFIQWDSITLRSMPREYIENCETEGFGYEEMTLSVDDVLPAEPRDTEEQVEEVQQEIAQSVSWLGLGEEGKRIRTVLEGVDEDDEVEAFDAWEAYLRRALSFPFEARVTESKDGWVIRQGDRLRVTGIAEVDDTYGVIADVVRDNERYQFPLCKLEAVDQNSANWQLLKDHAVWWANH